MKTPFKSLKWLLLGLVVIVLIFAIIFVWDFFYHAKIEMIANYYNKLNPEIEREAGFYYAVKVNKISDLSIPHLEPGLDLPHKREWIYAISSSEERLKEFFKRRQKSWESPVTISRLDKISKQKKDKRDIIGRGSYYHYEGDRDSSFVIKVFEDRHSWLIKIIGIDYQENKDITKVDVFKLTHVGSLTKKEDGVNYVIQKGHNGYFSKPSFKVSDRNLSTEIEGEFDQLEIQKLEKKKIFFFKKKR